MVYDKSYFEAYISIQSKNSNLNLSKKEFCKFKFKFRRSEGRLNFSSVLRNDCDLLKIYLNLLNVLQDVLYYKSQFQWSNQSIKEKLNVEQKKLSKMPRIDNSVLILKLIYFLPLRYDANTGKFTAPANGTYQFNVIVSAQGRQKVSVMEPLHYSALSAN